MRHTLQAEGLTREYRAGRSWRARRSNVVALDGVSLTLAEGEGIAIVGPSGSGKTTLLTLLLQLDHPTGGRVLLDGKPVADAGARRRLRRLVQFVPQDPASTLDPRRSMARQLAEPLVRLGVAGDHDAMVREALDRVGLDESFLGRRAHQVSGGQAQRLAIARALVPGPRLLLADEPVSGLDLPLRCQVLDLLEEIQHTQGIGIALVTHDLGAARQLCSTTHVMEGGRVVEAGKTEDLLADPRHETTRRLVAAIPRLAA